MRSDMIAARYEAFIPEPLEIDSWACGKRDGAPRGAARSARLAREGPIGSCFITLGIIMSFCHAHMMTDENPKAINK